MTADAHGVPHVRRGLVIGAGGALGGAWAVGVLCALAESEGFDATSSEVVVGTSAGSVLAALIGGGMPPRMMAWTVTGGVAGSPGVEAAGPAEVPDHIDRALAGIPRPIPLPGNLRLVARTLAQPGRHTVRTAMAALAPRGRGDLTPVGELIEAFCGDRGWPDRPRMRLVAMDFDCGRRVVFGEEGAPVTTAAEAVMASCSAPGRFPPRWIGDRRYIDGGAVSVTNADLLETERLDEVVVLAPMAISGVDARTSKGARFDRPVLRHLSQRLRSEVAVLTAAGASVRVFTPGADELEVMGSKLCDARRRSSVFETAVRTTTSRVISEQSSPSRLHDAVGAA